jgi:hypothetical protein
MMACSCGSVTDRSECGDPWNGPQCCLDAGRVLHGLVTCLRTAATPLVAEAHREAELLRPGTVRRRERPAGLVVEVPATATATEQPQQDEHRRTRATHVRKPRSASRSGPRSAVTRLGASLDDGLKLGIPQKRRILLTEISDVGRERVT